ncbi:Hpt domain-containing protein [Marinobacter sp. F3R11]|uniref:hybrid sensor histidine kinase/response regulator n=1 Tax=Marinobacter sp. F3R11 TaxID=2267231 RepID=UPI000DEA7507|nr:Hpt domain-containing protein [Marinobacter sp. F3R11]RBW49209.1 hybrid sensor histidine kinase/response regulator [Marinobacter sp. F3R11]
MGNHHDSIALDWVRGEIQDTLTQGQHALEAYVENRDDSARLRFCLNYLHQVHGTLKMVELYGAALLTEEMEKLTQAVLDNSVNSVDEAVNVLMQSILQLPQYLEHLDSSQDDFPMVLLPLLNDLRAARGEPLLSDTSLFKPDMGPSRMRVAGSVSQRLQDPKVLGHIRKLRQMYQFALAGIVREEDLSAQFAYLQKVIHRLIRLCQQTPRGELWKAAAAFVETLEARANPVNAAVKSLLRDLDSEIRRLIDEHGNILAQPAPDALLKHLLYYVARANDLDSDKVRDLRSRYQLEQALPSEGDVDAARTRVSGPGREAIHSVVSALNEELAKLKDQLDLFVRSEVRQNNELEDLLPGLVQVGNTLAVLGLGIPRKVITEQIELIEKVSAQSELVDDGTLMDIAGALLYVEASLASLDNDRQPELSGNNGDNLPSSKGFRELGEASSALLRESRNTLEQVKSAVINFIASQWDTREIEHVPGLLHSIRGGLSLVPLERVSTMLASAERYISDVLLSDKHVPDWKQLDTLADAITSIEYYLERLDEGISDNEDILKIAEESLASLGFPVGEEPTWDKEPAQDDIPVVEQTEVKTSDEDLLDDEILGVFVEEAEEVLQTIEEFYPRLRQDHDDRQALTEVRRAFHTLKGSGRLVGANSLGELAWSVENLLNRVIDQTIKPNDELFALIDEANARIPSLIQEFREGQVGGDVSSLIDRAESMATTRRSESEEASASAPEDVSPEAAPEEIPVPLVAEANDNQQDDLIDDEILEIFIEEAGEVLDTIREYLPMLLRQHDDRSALSEVRRAFHTLKGSGRMVGAQVVGELAWSIENMLNRVIDGSIFMNDDIANLLDEATGILPALVSDFERKQPPSVDPEGLQARATALSNGEIPETSSMPISGEEAAPSIGVMDEPDTDDGGVDPVLLDIFESETETHLQTLNEFLASAGDKVSVSYTDGLSRALHTLKGSAHTAGITPIAAVIAPLEHFIKESRSQNLRADRDVLSLIERACNFLTQGLAQLRKDPQASLPGTDAFLEKLQLVSDDRLRTYSKEPSPEGEQPAPSQLVQLFLNEGLDVVLNADPILDQWSDNPQDTASLNRLNTELTRLTNAAADAGLPDVAALSEALQEVYEATIAGNAVPDAQFFPTVRRGHEHLINMMDQVAAGLAITPGDELVAELEALAQSIASREPQESSDFDQAFTEDLEEIDLSFDLDELETLGSEQGDASQQSPSDLPLPETSEDNLDEELAEIFLDEARDLIDSTGEALQIWSTSTGNLDILRLLQRDLHTLKGGARLADIPSVGDLSHELENLFEGLTEQRLSVSDELSDLLFRCHDRLAGMVESMQAKELPRPAPDLISEIRAYVDSSSGSRLVTDVTVSEEQDKATSDEAPLPVPEPEEVDEAKTSDHATYLSHMDPELIGIFLEEAYDLINSTGSALHTWSEDPSNHAIAAELQRDVHTLKGGARMAGVEAIGDLTHVLEDLFERVAERDLEPSSAMNELLFACHDRLAQMVEQVATQKPCPPANELVDQVEAILRGESIPPVAEATETEIAEAEAEDAEAEAEAEAEADITPPLPEVIQEEDSDDELVSIFLDEAHEIHDVISECLDQWREDPQAMEGVAQLQQELHALKGGARLSDFDPIADLAEAWSGALDTLMSNPANQKLLLALSDRGFANLAQMFSTLEQGSDPVADAELLAAFSGVQQPDSIPGERPQEQAKEADQEAVDPEILEIFLEEAGEIMDQLDQLLDDWRKDPGSSRFNHEAQRALHTLKGGARLSKLSVLGDKAHSFEARLIELGDKAPDDAQWQAITEAHDDIIALVAEVRNGFKSDDTQQETLSEVPPAVEESPQPEISGDENAPDTQAEPAAKPVQAKAPAKARNKGPEIHRPAAQETIRVSAPLLDDLVNLAGETSITRGRLEQQSSDFGQTLDEMAATIERLREQLRRMEIETETQILFSAEKEHGPDYGDAFDPLEMDRYSSIQQLSRALTESSSDLADLRETLSDRVRDTETLLVQQSRINTELQEGLMKTRMIPFSSMVPRLRRIVRQISNELGKKVEFDVRNAEGEMDRNILERMIAPLEHMLRNAVDHGIESPAERLKNGKPETGEVTLSLVREGGDVVLRMMDDGAGIPSEVIRDKAIRQGLLQKEEDLSEREILQFILQPGFSTAQQVTQISGRGVGMDVVATEIKQLGGSLDIESQVGRGTMFTVRLPFTVSVNRALMVSTGEDFYAIPLNTIEGIVRVSTYELEEYYKPDAPLYEYAGQEYRLQYLGSLLNSDHQPKLQGQALPLPVILVRGADQPMALQVDNLMGSREIVVKSLGPQFSSVRGVSGATILGDGNVVVILDLPAMIRSDILSERQRLADLEKTRESARYEERATVVMVVDDSVTVRKVTSRLLERNGMEVITAKDGLDAVAQLQDHKPDIMLLDIEMPRMDGFEVASFVRHDDTLRDMPICMITSRTGEKHRERALSIGVNEYLGKPFQETELLKTIERLTGKQ